MAIIYPQCSICGLVPENGLYDGLYLRGKFICSGCEKKLVATGPDSANYEEQIQYIRGILFTVLHRVKKNSKYVTI